MEIQNLLDDAARELGVVGAQVAIFDKGELREFATGSRDRELGLPVTTDTLFQVGSTTKVFNAAMLMSLVDAKRLDLDTPVQQYIPNFRVWDRGAQQILNLRQLLSMSAGLDNGSYMEYGRGDDALGRYVDSLSGFPQIFQPGTAFGYSNANTNISGHAAACVTGQSWERLVQERILDPLSLKHSTLSAEALIMHPVALGYFRGPRDAGMLRMPQFSLTRSMGPAGGTLCSTAGDLARFARMMLNDGKSADGKQVLSAEAVKTMHTPQVTLPCHLMAEKWCVGPYMKTWDGVTIYGHSGTNLSGSSMLLWCPEKQFAIATTVNVSDQGYPLSERIFDIVFPRLFGIKKPGSPNPATTAPVKDDLQKYAGQFEAFGVNVRFSAEGDRFFADVLADTLRVAGGISVLRSELIPLGEGRFLACNPVVSGNRNWDMAFWGENSEGKASHFLNGMFAMRRTG